MKKIKRPLEPIFAIIFLIALVLNIVLQDDSGVLQIIKYAALVGVFVSYGYYTIKEKRINKSKNTSS